MLAHLRGCVPAAGPTFLHLRVEGHKSRRHWIDVAADPSATLRHLDQFLRRLWLECCGHLSAFHAEGVQYTSSIDRTWPLGGPPERSQRASVGHVFTSIRQRVRYEYDFGSTTALTISVAGARPVTAAGPRVRLLARNEPPVWPCAICAQPATLICAYCRYDDEPFVCDAHAGAHACGEEGLLPVVNSPRMGTCGYTGEPW